MSVTSQFHKIRSISEIAPFRLRALFENGVEKEYDLSQLSELPAFALLFRNPAFVKSMTVEPGGYGVSWNEQIDLSCEEIWSESHFVE